MNRLHNDAVDWEPGPHERVWYRHRVTGDRAYLVREGGKDMLRLDRPLTIEHNPARKLTNEWEKDETHRPIPIGQLARLAYGWCRELNTVLGRHEQRSKDWLALTDAEKQPYLSGQGPPGGPEARMLYKVAWKVLSGLAR